MHVRLREPEKMSKAKVRLLGVPNLITYNFEIITDIMYNACFHSRIYFVYVCINAELIFDLFLQTVEYSVYSVYIKCIYDCTCMNNFYTK